MASISIKEAEVERKTGWEPVGIAEANALPKNAMRFRCRACGGQMTPFPDYSDGALAHFEHRRKHTGCKLSAYCFAGKSFPHPQAIS